MRIIGVTDNRTTFVIKMKLKGPYYLNYNDPILTLATKVNNMTIITITHPE